MAEIVLFHHALGITEGVVAIADRLHEDGHVVHVPDLFDGRHFRTVEEGMAHVESVGFDAIVDDGVAVASAMLGPLVAIGLSLGVLPATALAMRRPGVERVVLLHSAVPPQALGGDWPAGVPAQIHVMADDPWGDVDDAQAIAAAHDDIELFLYPGSAHLFTDDSLDAYDADAAELVVDRVLAFLA